MSKKSLRLQVLVVTTVLIINVDCGCRYRNVPQELSPEAFSYFADWGCYKFRNPDQFLYTPIEVDWCPINDKYGSIDVPGIAKHNDCILFDHSDSRIQSYVASTFTIKDTMLEWFKCCEEAANCCTEIMMDDIVKDNHCPSLWDGWSCFPETPAETKYEQICSKYAYTGEPPRCLHFSYKECYSNSSWEVKTDYASCAVTNELIPRTKWHISTLTLSIIICVPAAIILLINKNLIARKFCVTYSVIIAIIVRNFIVILTKAVIVMDELTAETSETILNANLWPCKLLVFFEKLAGNAVFTCMFLEGIYLHQILTNVYKTRQHGGPNMKIWYACGATVSVVFAVTWAIVMAVHNDKFCWMVTQDTYYNWINDLPRLIMLALNCFLLSHILCTLWDNFRGRDEEPHPGIRTVKASLMCLPLFGVPYIFVIVHPDTDSCGLEQFYYFVYYAVEAAQGISIAILHCYTEREIKKKIKEGVKQLFTRCSLKNQQPKISQQTVTSQTVTTITTTSVQFNQDDASQEGATASNRFTVTAEPNESSFEHKAEGLNDTNQQSDGAFLSPDWAPKENLRRNSSEDSLTRHETRGIINQNL